MTTNKPTEQAQLPPCPFCGAIPIASSEVMHVSHDAACFFSAWGMQTHAGGSLEAWSRRAAASQAGLAQARAERIEWLFRKKLGADLAGRCREWIGNYESQRDEQGTKTRAHLESLYSGVVGLLRELAIGIDTLALKPDFREPSTDEEMAHFIAMEQKLIDEGKLDSALASPLPAEGVAEDAIVCWHCKVVRAALIVIATKKTRGAKHSE